MLKGKFIDNETRCVHYHSVLDVIAIKFKCCNIFYPCYYCHEEATDHLPEKWSKQELNEAAILCGVCKYEMTIQEYKNCNYLCPHCSALFNPKCSNHDHLYFEQ